MTEKLLSFAECMAKLERVSKELTPEMKDIGTQTEVIYVFTVPERDELVKLMGNYQTKVSSFSGEVIGVVKEIKDELEKTRQTLNITVEAKEDAVIHNQQLQELYASETKDLRDQIVQLNQDIDNLAINYTKSVSEKEAEKTQLREQIKTLSERVREGDTIQTQLKEANEKLTNKIKELENAKEEDKTRLEGEKKQLEQRISGLNERLNKAVGNAEQLNKDRMELIQKKDS